MALPEFDSLAGYSRNTKPAFLRGCIIMSVETATNYADQLAARIREDSESGYPFGVRNVVTDDVFDSVSDALAEGVEEDDIEEASGMDWLSDVLDIQYMVTGDREYRSARILIAFGGPNAWIDTRTGQLEVSWWSETVTRDLPADFIRGLDDALAELWDC